MRTPDIARTTPDTRRLCSIGRDIDLGDLPVIVQCSDKSATCEYLHVLDAELHVRYTIKLPCR